jgi:hypothetical protein
MLDVEAQDSFVNLEWFVNPFNCYFKYRSQKTNELLTIKSRFGRKPQITFYIGLVVGKLCGTQRRRSGYR